MKPLYINSLGCVSTQKTFDNNEFLEEVISTETNVLYACKPNYKAYLDRGASRRMGAGVKMGIVASSIAMKEANLEKPDAIITGTGMGCLRDSEKFLKNIIDNEEQFLTPTSFIQSTHNTVGAQVALGLKCKAYNVTYVHAAMSFESALIDAILMFEEKDATNILVGAIEENGDHTIELHKLIHHIKENDIHTDRLLKSKTKGTIFGEGAQFFVLSTESQNNSYAQLKDLEMISLLNNESPAERIQSFLQKNNLSTNDIDAVVLGNNGDIEFDRIYHDLQNDLFNDTEQICYKHLSGEYNTASAFGFWVAAKIMKTQSVPTILNVNSKKAKSYKNILLYNQYRGRNHSIVLMGK